ncbi:uncharacterized protein LOC131242102 [Magnolia sinica]|uniref:uncharacterized protein LOC131242102 n=1 Tax=Magnolia sinica TaxID=86752 RepID=UPI002657C149|nr:uncharacterized protein LOC131242102 [Magnolia sinica]XP_058096489.1 uncharacterized protein LOC131242102 [Magnolia sinica]XP_058096490.1 uncharacterized protein LOC131242102 [Magnolia sinica]
MSIQKNSPFNTHLDLMSGGSDDGCVYRRMVLFVSSCWVFISSCLFYAFRFLTRHLFRFGLENGSQKEELENFVKGDEFFSAADDSGHSESLPEVIDFEDSEYDGFGDKEPSRSSFKFQPQGSEDIGRSLEESEGESGGDEIALAANIHKYCFLPEKDSISFVEEPEVVNFSIEESYVGGDSAGIKGTPKIELEDEILSEKDFQQFNSGKEEVHGELLDLSYSDIFRPEEESEKSKEMFTGFEINTVSDKVEFDSEKEEVHGEVLDISYSDIFSREEESEKSKEMFIGFEINTVSDEVEFDSGKGDEGFSVENKNSYRFLSSRDFCEFEEFEPETTQKSAATDLQDSWTLDVESIDFKDGSSSAGDQIDSYTSPCISSTVSADFSDGPSSVMHQIDGSKLLDDFLSEKDFSKQEADSEDFDEEDEELMEEVEESKEVYSPDSRIPEVEFIDFDNGFLSIQHQMNNSKRSEDLLSEHDSREREFRYLDGKETEPTDELQKSETTHLPNRSSYDSDDENDLESLWEHQDLIEQLRMELKKVKATGLPTIFEESESPKSIEDLKPWKIEEKFLHEDPVDELQKLHKSYRERMRKLDILNYQKMYAIGFLQLKDPLQSIACRKTSIPAITSLLSQNLRTRWSRKPDDDPSSKFIKDLQSDLETVYVGQACLSWELLHWQYVRSRDLPESDTHGYRQYNQVAGEFQQFQVLLQRFVENEAFQGPRVQHYVKSRCVLRNLLQVPPIKEDCSKEKMVNRSGGNDAVTGRMLGEIMEESMRIFWEFIKADRDEAHVILKGLLSSQAEVQDPSDPQLLANIQADLQKKEKKLKDIQRSGNCIVKKFQKPKGDCSDDTLFFSKVDLTLVSRVLRMSRITNDQLLWCDKKLSMITFKSRKLCREPSFLLFPC